MPSSAARPGRRPLAGPHRVSMTDVASHAGVSQKTVSRVVNGEPNVSAAVAARVEASIRALGFRPNAAARALVTQRSRRIGMVTIGSMLHGPARILDGVESAVRGAGYSLSVVGSGAMDVAELQSAIDQLVGQGVEGIVLSDPSDSARPGLLLPAGIAVLSFDAPSAGARSGDLVVGTDELAGARSATEHLVARGHRGVLHLAGPENWASSRRRADGWLAALQGAGLPAPALIRGDWSPASGFHAMRSVLHRSDITAVFAANDHMAIGAMAAIEQAGLRIPEDVGVVGFDDAPESAFLHIPLSTVRQDFDEVTRQGVSRLIQTIEGRPPAQRRLSIAPELVLRGSSA